MLRYILLTHGHHDHVGGVSALARQFGVTCHIHRGDARLVHHAPMYAWRFGQKKIEMPAPVTVYDDQPEVHFGGQAIQTIHTPGHTLGGVSYLIGGAVFTGDTLLFQHIGRVDLPGGDRQQIRASVDRLVSVLAPETIVFPGHGRSWTMGEARIWWRDSFNIPSIPQRSFDEAHE